jgi:hypothetical protein
MRAVLATLMLVSGTSYTDRGMRAVLAALMLVSRTSYTDRDMRAVLAALIERKRAEHATLIETREQNKLHLWKCDTRFESTHLKYGFTMQGVSVVFPRSVSSNESKIGDARLLEEGTPPPGTALVH